MLFLLAGALPVLAVTRYVKPGGNDSNAGTSWSQAYQTLQKAIEVAVAGDEIWLAAGTYYPTKDIAGSSSPADARAKTFFINKNIAIYGGFNGTESSLTQRNWRTNIATLSGNLGAVGDDSDNAYHVVYILGVSGSMLLDGVAITKGNANGSINGASGLGGGILVYATGGITSEPAINNCRIYDNRATGGGGAGTVSITSGSSLPTFTNCLFENNVASSRAGAVYSLSDGNNLGTPFSISVFEYCTFYNNDSPGTTKVGHSRAINDGGSTVTFDKCIIWGDPTGTYLSSDVFSDLRLENSLSKGGCTTNLICAGTILNVDPLFVNAAGGNLRLTAGSPAADVSGGEYYTGSPTGKDYDGNNRPVGCYDYGAFESTTSTAPVITCYQDMDNDGYGVAGITKQFCTVCAEYWADNTLDCDDNSSAISPYTVNRSGTFSPVAGAGTSVTLADDAVSSALPIGFTFSFFGNSYTNFAISSNGFITFSPFSSGCCIGQSIPNTSAPNNLIALAWEDLDPSSGGSISYFTTGTAPNRKLIVNYSSVAVIGNSSTVSSQLILYETSNIIEIHSASIGGLGSGTMGLENSDGTVAVAVPGRNSANWSTTNDYVAFIPSTAGQFVTTFYRDMDGDGFGNLAVTQMACTQPSGYVANSTDCNDNNAAIKPGATEICDGIDNDCDGFIDEGAAPATWYRDMDGDGFGNLAVTQQSCTQPSGYVANSTDCNDNNAAIKPGATELCDGIDNDCDGSIDEGVLTTWYRDLDGDTYGNPASTQQACSQPTGYVANNTDCDDNDALEKPGQVWYKDTDNDGYAQTGAAPITQCLRPTGYKVVTELLATSGDCNDNNAAIKPGATEVCDGVDNDCDGSIDEGVLTTFYRDLDDDGFGDNLNTVMACNEPMGYTSNNTDCNDNDALEFPGQIWFKDTDNDGYAQTGAASITACVRPTGYRVFTELIALTGDCNDNNAAINPGISEVCDDLVDNDCDGAIDEGCILNYLINTTGTTIVITDISGQGEILAVSESSGNIRFIVTPTNRTYSLNGGPTTEFTTPADVALTGIQTITINTATGNDVINIGAFTTAFPSLTVNGGTGNDIVNFNGDISFVANAHLDVDMQNDEAAPGADQVNVATNTNLVLAGTGAATVKVSRSVLVSSGGSITTENGDLTVEANQQLSPTAGSFVGVTLSGGLLQASGTGTVAVRGKGGNSGANQRGVYLQSTGKIQSGSGTVTVVGTGGASTESGNEGVSIISTNSRITSSGGNVSVTGQGGGSGTSVDNYGIAISTGGEITAGGSATVSVQGTGGASTGNDNYGVSVRVTNSRITSSGGNVSVTGQGGGGGTSSNAYGVSVSSGGEITAGGSGTVTVQGTGGTSTGSTNAGVSVRNSNSRITSSGGNVSVTGQGGNGAGGTNYGVAVFLSAEITAGGSGTVTVQGTASTSASGSDYGIFINSAGSRITSSGGNVSVTGQGGGSGSSSNNHGIFIFSAGEITAGGSGTVTVQGTGGTTTASTNYGISINGASSRITSSGGNVSATGQGGSSSADIITQSGGLISSTSTTAGITLHSTNNGMRPNTNSTDVSTTATQKTTFGTGSKLTIFVSGLTAHTQYQQLGVVGMIDLNGADLVMLNTIFTPASGNTFTIVDNDGTDAIIGTFNGLPEGATIPNFLGSGLNATITYLGGTGNDVVITVASTVLCYADTDGDGYGDPNSSMTFSGACGIGYVSNNTDCDDEDPLEKPGQVWYADVDNDGYSSGTTLTQCLRPVGYKVASELTATNGDCNDNNSAIKPSATEICDGIDNNCNGSTDEGVLTTYYADADNDGFGNPAASQQACSQPSGYVTNNTDCDDNDNLEFPGQVWYKDADGDDYSDGTSLTQCLRPANHYAASELIATTGDCNDSAAAINPGATEICDGIDNNCNGSTDEGVTIAYYADADGDGFGNPAISQQACSQPSGYVANKTDCDDNDALEKPGQIWYADVDNDGYSSGTTLTQCLRPVGYKVASELTATSGDCNDNNFAIKPGATEICDGIDNNCNGSTDEGVTTTYYADADNDGFGNPSVSQQACSQPSGYVTNNTDCDDNDALEKPGQTWYADVDNDGYSSGTSAVQCLRPTGYKTASELTATSGDCNDNVGSINPGATEICDGIDNNCNGSTDEGGLTTYYADADNDGFGNPAVSQQACSQPSGYVTNNTDCDDNDALEKPGQIWYADVDNDGYSSGTTLTQCLRPVGYKVASELTAISGDCNDNNFAIKPGATEICDGIDNNCNGSTDEGVTTIYYADVDNDGFGNPAVSQQACSQPAGYVTNNTDCDDNDALEKPGQIWYADVDNDGYSSGTTLTQCLRPVGYKVASELTATSGDCNDNNFAIKPGATEICDGIDNNCNGSTDEGVTTTYYADADNDGFGNPAVSQQACSQPAGYVTNNTDCDDNDALEKPGQTWYADVDNDGYSSGTTAVQCLRPTGYKTASELTATSGDCNDNVGSINPGATEICDGIDNNCNGSTDEGGLTTYYADADNDGFGNPAVSQQACSQPSGYVTNNTDCDDNDALEKPGQIWYADVDNDGYSSGTTLTQCLRPVGYKVASELTATSGDCNDNDFAIKPGATEICDGIDNNCNGSTDEGVTTTYYADSDNDGFGNSAVSQQACSQPAGYVTNNTDCDDNDALEKPGQTWYADVDNDGYSSGTTAIQCLRPTGYKTAAELTATSGDCNDNVGSINPGATEICDGIDNNCNGSTDEGGLTTYYADADNDGFGNPAVSQQACSQPAGYVTNNTDCDDNDALEKPGQIWYADVDNDGYSSGTSAVQCLRPTGYKTASELTATSGDCNDNVGSINPGATEICDGIDNNCNGSTDEGVTTTYYADADNDGFGNPAVSQQACSQPAGYVTNNTDCDDNDALEKPGQTWYADVDNDGYSSGTSAVQCLRPTGYKTASELTATSGDCNDNVSSINPGATEICDGIDNNCNGSTDEGGLTTYYADADNDGFGNPAVSQQACSQPAGYVTNNTDCDDNDALEKPGQIWYADVDNDGYSSGTTLTQCLRPVGYKVASELTATSGDCNDSNFAIKPSATEICDGIDNNCNGSTDEGVTTTYYADADNDGFGNAVVSQQACSQPAGYVTNNTDCDDNDALEKPGQVWYADVDNDGYSSGTTLTQCLRPVGYKVASELTATSGDCNDSNNANNPGATEVCDGVDNNCDGVTDEGCTPPMVSIHDPCTCMNNSPLIENGTTTNAGTFSETVTVEGPAGQSWTIVSVTGLYSDVNATTAYIAGAIIPETGAGTGIFELFGYHRDGAGYTISVTNGRGDTLSIGNTCYYPDPVFTGLPALISPNAAPFTVTGTVANNAAGTGTFILDGNTQSGAGAAPTKLTINPATLSVGTHTLVYSFDAGAPGAANPNDPGCVQQVQQRFRVAHCGCQDVTVSQDENCQFLLTGNLVSDVNCGGGTVRVMDNDPSNGGLIDCAGVWTYGLFDAFGNIICWGKVTAEDKTAPALVCAPADITLDCYDVNYVLNNRLTIGNTNATSSPRPAASGPQTINNAEGLAGTGDNCQLGLAPPSLVNDNIKNLGYAYFKDNCYNCGCRITLKWSDKVEFYSCEQMKVNGGYYAVISREWTATDCNGLRSSYVQKIKFTRPAVDDFVFKDANPEGKYDHVVEYNSCTPDKSLIKKENVTPYVCSYFNTSANPRCLFIDQVECNYSISIKDTEFPICGGKGVKIDRELYVLDWCAGGIVDTFHILIKIGDFTAPTVEYAHGAPYDISTGPMDCTAAIPVTVAGIKTAFGVTIKDNCNLGNISVSVYTKDRYVKGILVYEGPEDPLCEDRCLLCGKQGELRGDHEGYQLGACDKDKICWDKVEYAVMNGMMIGLPVGKHLMVIDAFDGCYNASTTCFVFDVKDKIAPIMKCDDDLHVTLSNANGYTNGYAQVSAADIDEGSWDNCKLAWIAVRRNVPDGCAASFIQKGYDTNGNGKLDALPADGDVSKADGFDRNGDGDIADFGETFILKGGKLMTPLLDFVEFFCCDLTERVTVELWGGDIYGNTNYCWMDLLIEDKVAPTCLAPWDVTIYCDDKNIAQIDDKFASAKIFGDVTIPTGNDCAALDTAYSTEKKLKCGAGYIDRIWTLTKQTAKGPISVTCKQRIHILPVHEYNICFPKDVSTDCKTPIIDTVITDELGCDILAVNVHDKRYDASDDECYKIFRTYSVINWCTYDDRCGDPLLQTNVSIIDRAVFGNYGKAPIYVLVRDRKGNKRDGIEEFWVSKDLVAGNADDIDFTEEVPYCEVAGEFYHSFIYTQIIKVYDDTRPVVTGTRDTFCTSPTACTANITKVVTLKDKCTDKVELETQFLMIAPFQTLEAGKMILYSTPRWSTKDLGNGQFEIKVANLPEGTHDLIVVGRDECGNLSLPTRIPFVVKDCKAPAPICINGLSTGIMPDGNGGGMMAVWATDFVASKIYDCNGQGPETKDGLKLVTKYSINRVGQPVNKDQTGLNFTCADINNSPILVELHAWDEAGNHDFCITFVELIDSRGVCPGSASGVNIAGTISTEGNANLQGASITLSGAASQNATTAANGAYSFVNLSKGGDFTVTPQLDKNHLNGVSTFDLVLIQKHILGVQALNSPYKMIAADANNSKTISTLDLIALRKLILNIDTHFANNTSWRFVDASYVFPNPTNPWSTAFPEVVSINDIASNVTANFVAIKVGDVNASASVNGVTSAEIRTNTNFQLKTQEQNLKSGNEYKVTFTAEDLKNIQGYQFALNLDQSVMELLDIEYGVAKAENFGVFKNEGIITTSWNSKYEAGALFTLVLRAKADAKLSQSINLNRLVSPEAYDQNNENLGIALNFEGIQATEAYELRQNTPNPFSDETLIGFTLPKAMKGTLTVRDVKGALIYKVEGNYAKGSNQVTLKKSQLGASGVLYYTLETTDFTATKKMVILE